MRVLLFRAVSELKFLNQISSLASRSSQLKSDYRKRFVLRTLAFLLPNKAHQMGLTNGQLDLFILMTEGDHCDPIFHCPPPWPGYWR